MTIAYIVFLFLLVFIGLGLAISCLWAASKDAGSRKILYFISAYMLASVFAFIKLAVEAIITIK